MPRQRHTFRRPRSPYWHYDFIVYGHRYIGSTQTERREIAEAIVAKIRADAVLEKALGQKPRLDIERAFARYWVEEACKLPSAGDIDRGLKNLGKIGNIGLHDINDAVVSAFVSKRRGDKVVLRNGKPGGRIVSPGTVNRELDLLKAILNRARRWGVEIGAVDWPAHRLREPAPRERFLSTEEAERLLSEAAPHLKGPILFALLTGARRGNVERLDWSQIDMRARVVTFRQKSKLPGGKPHAVSLAEPLWLYLANLGPKEKGPVWLYQGHQLKDWSDAFRNACRRAGIKGFRWHDLRHTAASWMMRGGVHMRVMADVLGHSSIRTTERYANLDQTSRADAVAVIATHLSRTVDVPGPDLRRVAVAKKRTR